MEPDASRVASAQHFQAEITRPLGVDRVGTFGIYKACGGKQRAHTFERGRKQATFKWWIEEHDVESTGGKPCRHGHCIAGHNFDLRGFEPFFKRYKSCDQARIALDHQHAAGATRRKFEAQDARAGEKIQSPQRLCVRAQEGQPVDQRFADAVGRRSQAGDVGDHNRRALPGAADDANAAVPDALALFLALR